MEGFVNIQNKDGLVRDLSSKAVINTNRIEYENFTNDAARNEVRTLIKWSSFDDGKPKGEYVKAYKSRKQIPTK